MTCVRSASGLRSSSQSAWRLVRGRGASQSNQAEGEHCLRHAHEAEDVRPDYVVSRAAELLGGLITIAVNVLHDLVQTLLRILERPRVTARVLLHLERRGRDAPGIRGLARAIGNARLEKHP